jgi:hypothetical protein
MRAPMFTIHATRKLLDRVGCRVDGSIMASSTALGDWYATALFWKPQVALLVNEKTLFPVLMPLAPATTLIDRFPAEPGIVLDAHGIDREFIEAELAAMGEGRYAKTTNRSTVGVMNEFALLAGSYRREQSINDLLSLALELADTPCGPLYPRHITPAAELQAMVASSR